MANDIDAVYAGLIDRILKDGGNVQTRNSKCKRVFGEKIVFTETPLVGVRKTAWRNAIREWEWFMTGSNNINDLHESVRHWWRPFCKVDKHTLCYNYGKALRRVYAPEVGRIVEVSPSVMTTDDPATVPQFPRQEVAAGTAKHLGYESTNHHGDKFRVVGYLGNSEYLVQFDSNGYCVRSKATNFLRGTVRNPYFPTVLGVGCYGVVRPKDFTYYKRAYSVWSGFMERCYGRNRRNYKWYGAKGVRVAPRWKCFEYFIEDLSRVPGFEEWLSSPGEYDLDKDYRKANYYGPDVCVFLPNKNNVALAQAERFYSVPRRVVELDQVANFIEGIKEHPYSRRHCMATWIPQHVHSGLMEPTNCHGTVIQAVVTSCGRLDMLMYQRSADVVCGLPCNWLQYWAFLQWLAGQTGRSAGSLTWIGGDVHVYEAHFDLARKIVASADKSKPTPVLQHKPSGDDFKADDFSLVGEYSPVLLDRAEMIV